MANLIHRVVLAGGALEGSRRPGARGLAACLAACVMGTALLPAARVARAADAFPDRPVKLIVAFAPGTGSDSLARIMSAAMAPVLGQPVIVDNRSGAGGVMGTEAGARAAPDGYTLTLGTTSTLLTNPALNSKVRYRLDKDFAPVAGLARTAFVLVVANTDDAPRDVAGLVRRLGTQSNASFGSAGVGTITHLATEYFLKLAHAKAEHVPYRGSTAALSDVAGGQLLFACDTPVAALPLIRAGKLRALAVTSSTRLAALPEVSTAAEAGLPDWKISAWWGLVAPAGTPKPVLATLSQAAIKALDSPQVKEQLKAQQLDPMPLPPAEFGALMHAEEPFWSGFVKQSGIQVEF